MKTLWNILSNILCIIISTINYILLIFLLLTFSIKGILGYNTINKLLKNINITELVGKIDKNGTILTTLYDVGENVGITKENVNLLLESNSVKKLVAKYLSGCTNYLLTGDSNKMITSYEFVALVDANLDEMFIDSKIKISNENKIAMLNQIKIHSEKIIAKVPNSNEIEDGIDKEYLTIIRTVFSDKNRLYTIAIIILLTGLIGLIKWSKSKWIPWFSTSMILASIIGLVLCMLPAFKIESFFPGIPSYWSSIISTSTKVISTNFASNSILYLTIGIALLILYGMIKKNKTIED